MKKKLIEKYEAKAKIFKALSHPTRVFLLEELSKGEKCVCELTALVGDDITTVSKHLSIMKEAGILGRYKKGNRIFYFLETPCALKFLNCVNEIGKTKMKAVVGG